MPFEDSVLKPAAQHALQLLQETASVAHYPYPNGKTSFRLRPGYSYDIPKEEQCRSALYCGLLETGNIDAAELEWNLYGPCKSREYVMAGEIDIVVYCAGKIEALLEVKREWKLPGWNNARPDLKWDLKKVESAKSKIKEACKHEVPTAGVVVFRFDVDVEWESSLDSILVNPEKLYRKTPENIDEIVVHIGINYSR